MLGSCPQVDRLCLDLQLEPREAWHRLRRTVEAVNALAGALVVGRAVDQGLFDDSNAAAEEV